MMESALLTDRVAQVLKAETASEIVAEVLASVRDRLRDVGIELRRAEGVSTDPLSTDEEITAAVSDASRLTLESRRLTKAAELLEERHDALAGAEDQEQRRVAYEAALAERDAVAEELRTVYPKLAAKLTALLTRLSACEATLDRVNSQRPDGADMIAGPEAVVRGIMKNGQLIGTYGMAAPLRRGVKLPGLAGSAAAMGQNIWPPGSGLASVARRDRAASDRTSS